MKVQAPRPENANQENTRIDQDPQSQEKIGQLRTPMGADAVAPNDETTLQMRRLQSAANESAPVRQLKAIQLAANNSPQVQQFKAIQCAANQNAGPVENRTGLPDQLKSGIENLSGLSLDDVKVHYNSSKPAEVGAHAYAQGTDIHMASGQEQHLPHEAWHVVQQKQGRVTPTVQLKGVGINGDSALEQEADTMGAKAMQMQASRSQAPLQRKTAEGQAVRQHFLNVTEATAKGLEFRTLSQDEFNLNAEINNHLRTFQARPSQVRHQALMVEIEQRRQAIKVIHNQLTVIVGTYASSSIMEQKAFFDSYLADRGGPFGGNLAAGDADMNFDQIRALYDSLASKTRANNGNDGAPLFAERRRFLMFVMQSLHDNMGVDQYRNLNRNLGHRQIAIDRTGPNNLSAGLENVAHDGYARKTDNGNSHQDGQHLIDGGGSGLGFLREKFSQPYGRTPNPQSNMIGDVQINMDRDDDLLPVFAGMDGGDMRLFSGPKKMTVHHEVGHLNSMLEGVSGGGQAMGGELGNLTDQEEMYNIWGGPRGDRAYGRDLGLPERFDHRSLVTYYGGGGGDYQDFMDTLRTGHTFTSTTRQARVKFLLEVRRLVNGNWNPITKGSLFGGKPKGVKAIATVVNRGSVNHVALINAAATARDRVDEDRHPFTQLFYNTVAGFTPNNKTALIAGYLALARMTVPSTW